jgi:DNA-binding Lrp family transcriptional regulator
MNDWWAEIDCAILECLAAGERVSPAEVGRRVGMSEDAAASCLAMLAREGKIHITLVELPGAAGDRLALAA